LQSSKSLALRIATQFQKVNNTSISKKIDICSIFLYRLYRSLLFYLFRRLFLTFETSLYFLLFKRLSNQALSKLILSTSLKRKGEKQINFQKQLRKKYFIYSSKYITSNNVNYNKNRRSSKQFYNMKAN